MSNLRLKRCRGARGGFTLLEVLAAMVLMAIVLPSVMAGISHATAAAADARRHAEASSLAEWKLAEILAQGEWQNPTLSGDFGPEWPAYRWQMQVENWPLDQTSAGLQQVDLSVLWKSRGISNSVTLSTMAYVRTPMQ